ncbi:hypothetical protein PoB_001744800 [Plakobranchus ocellatus]|uniref:Uncharacterized protein n=1 Tax=Plakobranchus ocellatus TaxID=259542 RepID=A0AAV3Z8H2_9GAST|nr:hypothetical protein PoB_001744800 [Plakobranchus ocellatus]
MVAEIGKDRRYAHVGVVRMLADTGIVMPSMVMSDEDDCRDHVKTGALCLCRSDEDDCRDSCVISSVSGSVIVSPDTRVSQMGSRRAGKQTVLDSGLITQG